MTLRIEAADPASEPARALIAELDRYLEALYPPASNHLVPPDELSASNAVFLLARLGPQAAGCGALIERQGAYAELKRMYVRPDLRRCGVGRAILTELIAQARRRGLSCIRLETGIAQPEALALYESAGFRRCSPFADYREDPLSLFMQMGLSG